MDITPFCSLLLRSPEMIEDYKQATAQLPDFEHWSQRDFPASEVTYSASCSTASLRPTLPSNDASFFSQVILLASTPSCEKWWRIFNKLAQHLWKIVRKQKIVICSCKDLEALLWSWCPDLNSLLQRQDSASYKRLWFYFFMHLSWPHFVKCQVDLFIHNPSWCSRWQQGVVLGWRG